MTVYLKTYLQEFFTSADTPERLTERLISSGFIPSKLLGTFETRGAFLSLRDVIRPNGFSSDSPHAHGFVLDLRIPFEEIGRQYPVRRFFRKLDSPFAHGMYREAAHCINEYIL